MTTVDVHEGPPFLGMRLRRTASACFTHTFTKKNTLGRFSWASFFRYQIAADRQCIFLYPPEPTELALSHDASSVDWKNAGVCEKSYWRSYAVPDPKKPNPEGAAR
jgi:hypothetical protein